MSDNDVPFEIQMEIMKWLPVKPLIQFRSVSKPWKSVIDSSKFIKGYGARHTQPHSHILSYKVDSLSDIKFIRLVDDDNNETFKVQQQQFVMSPLIKQSHVLYVVGECHGLMCLFFHDEYYPKKMLIVWNPSIGKSFGIRVPSFTFQLAFGFGVCPVTKDPTIIKVLCGDNVPWHAEVFTLSSGVWNVIPSANLPRQSIQLNWSTQVVIDRFIYWGAREETFSDDGESTTNHMVVSFDLITKEFKVVNLPGTLTSELIFRVSVSKLRGSLVVTGCIKAGEALCYGVWVMEHDLSFRKLFIIGAVVDYLLGFKKNGETIYENQKEKGRFTTLDVYDPCTRQIKNLGISGAGGSFFMGSYKESLLLLDHSDLHIYSDDSSSK